MNKAKIERDKFRKKKLKNGRYRVFLTGINEDGIETDNMPIIITIIKTLLKQKYLPVINELEFKSKDFKKPFNVPEDSLTMALFNMIHERYVDATYFEINY